MPKKSKRQKRNIDVLVESIEELIDSKLELIEAENYEDFKGYDKIYRIKYKPSKSKIKKYLDLFISETFDKKNT